MVSDTGLRKLCLTGVISFLEFWKLRKLKRSRRKKYNRIPTFVRKTFTLADYNNDECLLWFRFKKSEIKRLVKVFELSASYRIQETGTVFSGIEGLCILLRRLSYPNRLSELVNMFGRDVSALSRIIKWMLGYMFENFCHLLQFLNQEWMDGTTFYDLAEACYDAGSYYSNIVGFIDGTGRPICRPKYEQRLQYSGYKKRHVLKYQSIVYPNGLIGRLDGPFNGHRHDAAILNLSRVKNDMAIGFTKADGSNFAVYGDPGYSNQKYIKVGYKNYKTLTQEQKEFNRDMSALRVSVEYGFGKIVQQFAYVDFKPNQKLHKNKLRQQFYVAALLVNCQCCLRGGNQVSEYFGIPPPPLEKYITKA